MDSVADMTERLRLTGILEECGYTIATLISPKSYVSKTAKVGKGVMIEPFVAVNCGAVVQNCCYIGTNATIDCGSEVDKGSTICCGQYLCRAENGSKARANLLWEQTRKENA